jgi:hypothetical protein
MADSRSGPTHRQMTRLVGPVALFGMMALGLAPALEAQSSVGSLYDKWQLDLSGALVIMGGSIRVDGSQGQGTDINTDDTGLPREKFQPRASVRWRPGHRHELELGYQLARRSNERTLDRDVIFGDSTFHVGADVDTKFRTDQAFLTYRYAFQARERSQLGVGVGVGVLPFKFELDVLGTGSNAVTSSGVKTFTGPTASLGVYGRWLLGERWYLESDIRGIAIKVDRIKASVVEGNLAGRYFFSNRFAADLGYGISSIRLTVDPRENGQGFTGKIKYPLQHVRLGLVLTL